MGRRAKTRPAMKWIGAGALLVVIGLWGLSISWPQAWVGSRSVVILGPGGVFVYSIRADGERADLDEYVNPQLPALVRRFADAYSPVSWARPDSYGFALPHFSNGDITVMFRPTDATFNARVRLVQAWLPWWIPGTPLAISTAVLWWSDRRRIPPGHCHNCGYNLTGNITGRCPECGTPTPSARRAGSE